MPAVTRKRTNDRPETWHIFYGDVRVGVIVERSGAPPIYRISLRQMTCVMSHCVNFILLT
jgi:hypothetical protein